MPRHPPERKLSKALQVRVTIKTLKLQEEFWNAQRVTLQTKIFGMSLEFFSKDVIGSLESIFFLKTKQNKTKQTKQNKAKRKQGRYYFNRVEIRIGYIIVKQMHHQLLERINFRLTFLQRLRWKIPGPIAPLLNLSQQPALKAILGPDIIPRSQGCRLHHKSWGKKFVCNDIPITLFLKLQRKLDFLQGFACLPLFWSTF